ncbi:hypothetical protein HJC23_000401 [Cyclotella cryptica]|uniref:Uncharacterized protein n=1 Tax=Cyclotella cryptica TaxID=29204 RepID=A0ABD3PJK2_9STRA
MIKISLKPPLARRAQDEQVKSNDEIDYLSFQKYNCDGMFLDWSGPSSFTTTLSAKVVEYDYDAYIETGSDKATALASIQNRLLRFVGEELFGDCTRRLSEGFSIKEINTSPGDQPSSSTPCAVEAEFPLSTQCMAVHGAMTVFYSPSSDMKSDEANIDSKVKAAIKRGMDTNVAVTDTTQAVYYIGDRDSFDYSNSMLMMNDNEQSFWEKNGALLLGSIAGALAILDEHLALRREDITALDKDIEIGHEITTQKSFKSKRSKKSIKTKSERAQNDESDAEEYADDSATQKYGTCCWN